MPSNTLVAAVVTPGVEKMFSHSVTPGLTFGVVAGIWIAVFIARSASVLTLAAATLNATFSLSEPAVHTPVVRSKVPLPMIVLSGFSPVVNPFARVTFSTYIFVLEREPPVAAPLLSMSAITLRLLI